MATCAELLATDDAPAQNGIAARWFGRGVVPSGCRVLPLPLTRMDVCPGVATKNSWTFQINLDGLWASGPLTMQPLCRRRMDHFISVWILGGLTCRLRRILHPLPWIQWSTGKHVPEPNTSPAWILIAAFGKSWWHLDPSSTPHSQLATWVSMNFTKMPFGLCNVPGTF